jgi:hypothetical protein
MTQTGLTVGQDRVADPLQFFDAYLNLNKPYFADIDPFGVTCVTNKSAMSSCGWFPNMHVKIPTKSPCVGADPNACVTIDETRAQKMADLAKCKAHQYQNCTWSDNMEWMALWWQNKPYFADTLFWVPGRGAPPRFVCKQRCDGCVFPGNIEVSGDGIQEPRITAGMQFRLPFPRLVPVSQDDPWDLSGCGGPTTKSECVDVPGEFEVCI